MGNERRYEGDPWIQAMACGRHVISQKAVSINYDDQNASYRSCLLHRHDGAVELQMPALRREYHETAGLIFALSTTKSSSLSKKTHKVKKVLHTCPWWLKFPRKRR